MFDATPVEGAGEEVELRLGANAGQGLFVTDGEGEETGYRGGENGGDEGKGLDVVMLHDIWGDSAKEGEKAPRKTDQREGELRVGEEAEDAAVRGYAEDLTG